MVQDTPEHHDFRRYLQEELLRRSRGNRSYSMRAFARQLSVESAELSKILAGKRGISRRMFTHLADRLDLNPERRSAFWSHLPSNPASRREATRLSELGSMPPAPAYQTLTVDLFQAIADWYHYAILELTQTAGFRADPKWIARVLGITVAEVHTARDRLVRLGFLNIDSAGAWHDDSGNVSTVGNEFTATAFRRLQKQILEGALTALETIPLEERDQSSMTMAIDSRQLSVAKARIREFRRALEKELKSSTPYDSVYQLSISLYPVTQPISVGGKKP